jgi:hypothetical protein
MNRYGLRMKATGANRWLLLSQGDFRAEDVPDDEKQLPFTLQAGNDMLHHVSEKGWNRVIIVVDGKDTVIRIAGLEKYLEYIWIPKYGAPDLPLKMTEAKNRLRFKDAERIRLADDVPVALRFVSEAKVKLTQQNEFIAQLWEIRENGERLTGEVFSVPQPDRFSSIAPKNTITSYLYY